MQVRLLWLWNVGFCIIAFGLVAGCSQTNAVVPPPGSSLKVRQKVSGTVTFEGSKLTYGLVAFYGTAEFKAKKNGKVAPLAVGFIDPSGRFAADGVPTGNLHVAVVTDPDVDIAKLVMPGRAGEPLGGVKDAKGNKGPPGIQKGPDGEEFEIKMPERKLLNPLADKLSDEEKEKLREVNEKYGSPSKSGIILVVRPGADITDLKISLRREDFDLGKKQSKDED